MQAKFLLTLLTIKALLFSSNAANATTDRPMQTPDRLTELGTNIAKLTDIDRPDLIFTAIDRALLAQQNIKPTLPPLVTAGVPRYVPPQPELQPTIRGRVAKPKTTSESPTPNDGKNTEDSTENVNSDRENAK